MAIIAFIVVVICITTIIIVGLKGVSLNRCHHQWVKVDEIRSEYRTGVNHITEVKYVMQCSKCGEVKTIKA